MVEKGSPCSQFLRVILLTKRALLWMSKVAMGKSYDPRMVEGASVEVGLRGLGTEYTASLGQILR
jgi:hypothetical protein